MQSQRFKTPSISRIRISAKKFNLIVRCFALDMTARDTSVLTYLNRNTINRYYAMLNYLICTDAYEERLAGGLMNGIEIDESYFGAKRVRGKRGRGAGGKTIVLGLRKRQGRVYADVIPNAQKITVMPIIRRVVQSGSDIYTDGWRSYDALAAYGYNHKTVKHHEDEFVHGDSHVNGIESYWSWTKRRSTKFNGVKKTEFNLFLLESEWRFNHRGTIETDVRRLLREFRRNHMRAISS